MKPGPALRLIDAAAAMAIPMEPRAAGTLVALLDRVALERQNLTAIETIDDGVDRHLLDAIAGLAVAPMEGPIADIGSGGGFPGLVLAVLCSPLPVTLVESEGRKAEWLVRASEDLPNVRVVPDRTEHLAKSERGVFATVTARAVAPPIPTLELAAPLVADGGEIRMWSTPLEREEETALAGVARMLGFGVEDVTAVEPFPGARRVVRRFRRRTPTPDRFPRRPGRATSRPLVPPSSPSGAAS